MFLFYECFHAGAVRGTSKDRRFDFARHIDSLRLFPLMALEWRRRFVLQPGAAVHFF